MSVFEHLPGAHSDDWEWQLRGACRSSDPEMFFRPENERGAARGAGEAAAKAICSQCPVLAECREHARVSRERYGVWGGLSETERFLLSPGKVERPRDVVHDGSAVASGRERIGQPPVKAIRAPAEM